MIYITKFKDNEEYNSLKDSLKLPNVSVSLKEPKVYYNPYIESEGSTDSGSGSGSEEPQVELLEGAKILCKYNVSDTSTKVILYYQESSGSGSGSGSGDTPMFSSMVVDSVEQNVTNSYTFDTTGEHTVLFTLLEGETSIDPYAFQDCSSLTSVTIGNSVTSIGEMAFSGCSGLTSINVAANNQTYDSRNNCNAIIETSTNKLIFGCKNTIIPNSVTSIGDYAFNGSGITSITIGNSVTSIGEYAFLNCLGLTSVIIGNSVTLIGGRAFAGCKNLISVTIGNSVTSIGNDAFSDCSGLTSITIPNSVISIGADAFWYCSGLTSVIIGNSVTSIGHQAFADCSKLMSITCNATTAPTILNATFNDIKTGGTLTVPAGSTGYDVWMGTGDYYLGKYNWKKVEQ